MPKYGIATLLESYPAGYEFTEDNTPLHLTHVDSFVVDLDENELALKLQERLATVSAFTVTALRDEFFGSNKDIPVAILELNEPLQKLHSVIMQLLEHEGAVLKNPHFHNEGFAPHVSVYGPRRVHPGEQVHIKDVSIGSKIFEGVNPTHKILATVPLQ